MTEQKLDFHSKVDTAIGTVEGDLVAGEKTLGDKVEGDKVAGDKVIVHIHQALEEPEEEAIIPSNVPRMASDMFVGRDILLERIHEYLQRDDCGAISAVAGMGGVGKTALVQRYAIAYRDDYPGGICWVNVRGAEIVSQIATFARAELGLRLPEGLEGSELLRWCWSHWPPGRVLLVFDDVVGQETIAACLPPAGDRFRAVATTRERWPIVGRLDLEMLSRDAAVELLQGIVGQERVASELADIEALCEWLGYLPLALELVGKYLLEEEFLPVAELLEELQEQGVEQEALEDVDGLMTAGRGVKAAFEVSWEQLPRLAARGQEMGCVLAGFGAAPVVWEWIEDVCGQRKDRELKRARKALKRLNFIQEVESGQLLLHRLMREFLQQKLEAREDCDEIKRGIARILVTEDKGVPQSFTLQELPDFALTVPHWEYAIAEMLEWVEDEDLVKPFFNLGRFYYGQGLYETAFGWFEQCVETVKTRLGETHVDVATSLNNLAYLYGVRGHYDRAEPLYQQALALRRELLGEQHADVAQSLNNLAELYRVQGRYKEAEPLYREALALRRELLGEKHADVAQSLNNLANIYNLQGNYEPAEPLYREAIALMRELLGDKHPYVATSLNNLAYLFREQGLYEEAEPLYRQALALRQELLGEQHPDVAQGLNNLANLYFCQKRYEEAEPLYQQSLELRRELLGEEHPDVAQSLNNLADLFREQGRYEEAEPLYQQALALRRQLLEEKHPDIATSLNNLAALYYARELYDSAEPLMEQAFLLNEELLGPQHPHTVASRDWLAIIRSKLS